MIMKKKEFIALVLVFGVFLIIDTPLLAQSTGSSSSRESHREARSARVMVAPEIEIRDIQDFDYQYISGSSSSEKNSKLSLSKHYDGQTTSKKGTFSVEEGVRKIRLSISGDVRSGEIGVEVYLPGEEELINLSFDDSAEVSWSQSINISDDDTRYFGKWTYVITAEKAEGAYKLTLTTY